LKKQSINNLPVFDSDQDFLEAFEKKSLEKTSGNPEDDNQTDSLIKSPSKNKHGVDMLDDLSEDKNYLDNPEKEDFKTLLEESFKKKQSDPAKKTSSMPLKKRLKRYPPVEITLDLHGFNAIGARIKAKSFISSCKQQGYFTLRIIVGKGLHSELGPVLPDVIEDLLKKMKTQDQIIFYEWDKKKKSQSGAVVVYLKQFEQFD
jgi:DNA-nicking Smr family endonuclease